MIYSILSNLTGGFYSQVIEENQKFFINFAFDFLKNFDFDKNLNDSVEIIDKIIGFLYVNHRLNYVELNEYNSQILMKSKIFIDNKLIPKFKRKTKHFEIMKMNILSILFNYLNDHETHPDYIADYIIILIDMIRKIVRGASRNKQLSDNTHFYSFYQINDTKTFIYFLDILDRLKNLIAIVQTNQLKEIIFEENLLNEILIVVSTGNNSEVSMCCNFLLKLIANENIKCYLIKNKDRLFKENCNIKSLKTLLTMLL